MSKFNICNCFYTENYFLASIRAHLRYENDAQFQGDYADVPQISGKSMADLIAEVKEENNRRHEIVDGSAERRSLIQRNYIPMHKDIFEFQDHFLDPGFFSLWRSIGETGKSAMAQFMKNDDRYGLYQFPVFTDEFCRKLMEEVENFRKSGLPHVRPNTMNYHGVLLDEIGFTKFFQTFRIKYINPISACIYSEWTGQSLDSHRAFTVTYKNDPSNKTDAKQQRHLALHYDNAEVTLNVSLSQECEGGEISFGGIKTGRNSIEPQFLKDVYLEHKRGWGILHRGRQMHSALPIETGSRHNLILWMRSSSIRNRLCPMCWQIPKLIPVLDGGGYGDGFTDECETTK